MVGARRASCNMFRLFHGSINQQSMDVTVSRAEHCTHTRTIQFLDAAAASTPMENDLYVCICVLLECCCLVHAGRILQCMLKLCIGIEYMDGKAYYYLCLQWNKSNYTEHFSRLTLAAGDDDADDDA